MKIYNKSVSCVYEDGNRISLMGLAVPKFFEMIFVQLITSVTTLMISGYSEEAVAAISVVGQVESLLVVILNIVISGMLIVMSVEFGKENREGAATVAGTSLIAIIAASLFMGIISAVFSKELMDVMNLSGNTLHMASDFFKIKMLFLFVTMIKSCFNNMLICNGYAGYAVIEGIFCNILNAALGYIVLYSSLEFLLDRVTGVAVAAIVAQSISLLFVIYLFNKKKCPLKIKFCFKYLKRVLKIGGPSGLGMVSYTFTQVITTGFVASLGIVILNAKTYISTIVNYTSKIGWAVAIANGILVGRYRGKRDFESMEILHRQNMIIAVIGNFVLALLAFVFYKPLISMFSHNTEIIMLSGSIMAVDIIVEIARAINNISEHSLNANGDVKVTFIIPLITCWIFGVLFAYILGIKCGFGLIGCWVAFALDEGLKATLYSLRWKTKKWRETRI